jgi:hypothetical protein
MALGLLGALGVVGFGSSGEGQNRTADTAIFSRVLCQLSYLALSQARLGRSNENKALSVRAGRLLASMRPAPVEQPGVLISLSRRRPPVQIRSGALCRPADRPSIVDGGTPQPEAPSSSQVRTPPFQGGSTGSNPVGATHKSAGQRAVLVESAETSSSPGRVQAAGGSGLEPRYDGIAGRTCSFEEAVETVG